MSESCSWAACKVRTDVTLEDDWHHCRQHLAWHRAMKLGKEPGGSRLERDWHQALHGSVAAYRRHLRNKERPCEPCRIAAVVEAQGRRAVTR